MTTTPTRIPRPRHGPALRATGAVFLSALAACEKSPSRPVAPPPSAAVRDSPPPRPDPARTLNAALPPAAGVADCPIGLDDPGAPAILPRSHDIPGWIQDEPIRVRRPGGLASLIADAGARTAIESYRLTAVSHCVYRYAPPDEGEPNRLDMLWIEAAEPDDAFGLFSVMAPPPRSANGDGSRTAEHRASDGSFRLFGWQGSVCLQMTVPPDEAQDTFVRAARSLRARLLFSVPRADPPTLLRAMPLVKRLPGREWLVRHAAALGLLGAEGLPVVDPAALDEMLGLDGSASLAIAAYDAGPDEPPNVVWAAEYPSDEAATAAAERCRARVEQPEDDLDRSMLLGECRGRYVIGTWTAEQESIVHVLPRLAATLPP